PLQVVTTDRGSSVTAVRSCPSAAADRGRPIAEHLAGLKRLFAGARAPSATAIAPTIVGRTRRSWDDFHRVSEALERMLIDKRLPLVRRLVHALRFASLLEECKWKHVASDAVAELVAVLEQAACQGASRWFADREPPAKR